MRVLLLQPLRVFKRWPIPEDFTALIAGVPTLALPQLAGGLPEHECRIVDGLYHDFPISTLLRHVRWADIVLINAHSSIGSMNVEANVRILKKRCPDKPIVIGGHHATLYPREWLARGVDVVVMHEGERTLPELLDAMQRGTDLARILGIAFLKDGPGIRREDREMVITPDRPLIEDLDELPMPRWDLIDPTPYKLPLPRKGYATSIETSRGCAHACTFCAASEMWFHRHRFKSAERVLKEMEAVHRLGFRKAWVVDDNYGVRPSRDLDIYAGMEAKGLGIDWMCFIRADTVRRNPDAIAAAARAGLRLTLVGFESPQSRLLDAYGKSDSGEDYDEVSAILRKNGIFIGGFFIVGYPGETIEEARQTFEASARLADYPIISMFEPRMGTEAFGVAREAGRMNHDPFYHNTQMPLPGQEPTMAVYRSFYRKYLAEPRRVLSTVAGSPTHRAYYQHLYMNLVRSVLDVSVERLRHPWEMVRDLVE